MDALRKLAGEFFAREPVLILALLESVVVLGIAFGLPIEPEQKAALLAFAVAGVAFIKRQQVTPAVKDRSNGR